MDEALYPAPPPDAILGKLGPIIRENVIVHDRTFIIDHPTDSDRLLDNAAVRTAFSKDEYMPYWTDIWPASRMLAKSILQETWTPGTEAIEVGCGLGLSGIAALAMGLKVTFSDYDPCALRFASDNAKLNGFSDFRTMLLDWRAPPDDWKVPVILAADLIYEMRNLVPLIAFIKKLLQPGGVCLLTDVDRVPHHAFREALQNERLPFTMKKMKAGEPGGRKYVGTLYRINQT